MIKNIVGFLKEMTDKEEIAISKDTTVKEVTDKLEGTMFGKERLIVCVGKGGMIASNTKEVIQKKPIKIKKVKIIDLR